LENSWQYSSKGGDYSRSGKEGNYQEVYGGKAGAFPQEGEDTKVFKTGFGEAMIGNVRVQEGRRNVDSGGKEIFEIKQRGLTCVERKEGGTGCFRSRI